MTASVTQLRPHAPQPAPDEATATAAFTRVMWDAGIAEGYRRAYAELGISQPSRRLTSVRQAGFLASAAAGAAVLTAHWPDGAPL